MSAEQPSCIEYRIGSAEVPDSPWGRDEIGVFRDGRVVYKNLIGETVKSATARLSPSGTDQLFTAFAASPFTRPPSGMISPGGSAIELTAKLPARDVRMDLDYHAGLKMPRYAPVIRTLTGWIALLRAPAAKRSASDELTEIVDLPA